MKLVTIVRRRTAALIALMAVLIAAGCSNQEASAPPPPWDKAFQTGFMFDVDFVDSSYGWILTRGCKPPPPVPTPDPRATAARENAPSPGMCVSAVLRTTDGGKSWSNPIAVRATLGISPSPFPGSLLFLNRSDGFVFGGGAPAYATHDGGSHWSKAAFGVSQVVSIAGLGTIAWAVTDACNPTFACVQTNFGLWQTLDAGRSWSPIHQIPKRIGSPTLSTFGKGAILIAGLQGMESTTDGNVWLGHTLPCQATQGNGVTTIDGREIWLPCGSGRLLVSEDAGVTWRERTLAISEPTQIFLAPTGPRSALVSGFGKLIYMTLDAGTTWTQVGPTATDLGERCGLISLRFSRGVGGWAVGCQETSPGYAVWRLWATRDGRTWSLVPKAKVLCGFREIC
jgi:photosystem II stability/assembly factor-like uncharacterized protein